jgi:hypothetical protein
MTLASVLHRGRRPPHDQGQNALLEQIWNTLRRSVLPASHTLAGWKFGTLPSAEFGTLPSAELFPGIGADNPSNNGFLELDVKRHDALFLSRFAKPVSPIIERAFAAS